MVHSFLFYDGNLESFLAKKNRFLICHTSQYVIHEFWHCAKEDPHRIGEFIKYAHPPADEPVLDILQKQWYSYKDPYVRSALFLLLNQYSDIGLASSGKMNVENFNAMSVSSLYRFNYEKFHVVYDEEKDYLDAARNVDNDDYIIINAGKYSMNLFEEGKSVGADQTTVIHKDLQKFFAETENKCILIYQKDNVLFKMYKGSNITMIDKWGRKTQEKDRCEEVVIANF